MKIDLNVSALEKLVDYTASGIGSVAGLMMAMWAPWKAKKDAEAKKIAAGGNAAILQIQAEAQAQARSILISQDANFTGELDITETVKQRLQFQEQKRLINIKSVVGQTAELLGDKSVADIEPDHDWTARFFNDVQDVSSEEMQSLWAKILAGEVERPGSTSIRALGILKNLDKRTARLFETFCSACVFLIPDGINFMDARVPSLGGNAAHNSLQAYGLNFDKLNRLNEHGLIISDYNSWYDYRSCIINLAVTPPGQQFMLPFKFQDHLWYLVPNGQRDLSKAFELSGVAMTFSGQELSKVIDLQPMEKFSHDLTNYFQKEKLIMTEMSSNTK